jgi:hypothetical protein
LLRDQLGGQREIKIRGREFVGDVLGHVRAE